MIDVKVSEPKKTSAKKVISVKEVFIKDGMLTDRFGEDILESISNELPEGVEEFSFKITIELPEEDDEE